MVADIVYEYEFDTGRRHQGIFFAASSFSAKATTGVGNVSADFALDIIDWPRGACIRTAADVPAETIIDLGLVYGPLLAASRIFAI
jgi:glycoside/pentoside/hexuronide:cation symporter, GPH family